MLKIESSPKATGHTEKEPIGDSQPTFNRVLLETKGVNRIGQNEP